MPVNMEAEPRHAGAESSAERLFGDRIVQHIINEVRPAAGWDKINEAASRIDKQAAVRSYVLEVDRIREARLEKPESMSPRERTIFDIMFRTEMVNVWRMNARPGEAFGGIMESIQWQNKVIGYIADVNRQCTPIEAKMKLEAMWQEQERVVASAVNPNERTRLMAQIDAERRGILRVVAIREALARENGWDSTVPNNPLDDAHNKIDLITKSKRGNILLVQSKYRDMGRDANLFAAQFFPVPDAIGSMHTDFERGMLAYVKRKNEEFAVAGKPSLDPSKIMGIYCNVSMKTGVINDVTGMPERWFAEEIASNFRAADEVLVKRQAEGGGTSLTRTAG